MTTTWERGGERAGTTGLRMAHRNLAAEYGPGQQAQAQTLPGLAVAVDDLWQP